MSATKPKLLLADDSVTIRKVVEMTFAEENIEVFTANDGESAMLKFVETQPDIVLAHIGLPGTNGYQICEMIKQDETTRHIPVVLLAGSFEPFNEAEATRVKADGYLTKPFASLRDVVARVNDLLGHATAPVAAPESDDIDDLYTSSFAQTAEIDEFETVEDSFNGQQFEDHQFDDEMIETSSPAVANTELDVAQTPAIATVEHSREFDWSPDAIVSTTEAVVTQPAPNERSSIEQSNSFEGNDQLSAVAVAPATVELSSETEAAASPIIERETSQTEVAEPSPEFIALVAQRVVERLSDKAIREIAQDAVPRIAEKLMREALEQDKNQ